MSKPENKQGDVLAENAVIMTAALDLGAAVVQRLSGSEAVSNQLDGQVQSTNDIQQLLASRIQSTLGV